MLTGKKIPNYKDQLPNKNQISLVNNQENSKWVESTLPVHTA